MSIHTAISPDPNRSTYGPDQFQKAGLNFNASTGYPSLAGADGTTLLLFSATEGVVEWLKGTAVTRVIQFTRTVTLTSAAAAAGVTVIADADAPVGFTPYIQNFFGKVNGATNWATTATVKLQDTNGTPVDFLTFAVAGLTGNNTRFPSSTNITYENAYILHTGGTVGKGLRLIGDANGTGSDLVLTVQGFYRKTS